MQQMPEVRPISKKSILLPNVPQSLRLIPKLSDPGLNFLFGLPTN